MDKFDTAHTFAMRWALGQTMYESLGGYSHHGVSINFLIAFSADRDNYKWLKDNDFHPLPITRTTIRNITEQQARGVYRREYWDALGLDNMPAQMACILYDTAIVYGKDVAVMVAQQGYNKCVLHGVKLPVDGVMDYETRKALCATNNPKVWDAIIEVRKKHGDTVASKMPRYAGMQEVWLKRANALHTLVERI